jgi:hypothetical protein
MAEEGGWRWSMVRRLDDTHAFERERGHETALSMLQMCSTYSGVFIKKDSVVSLSQTSVDGCEKHNATHQLSTPLSTPRVLIR